MHKSKHPFVNTLTEEELAAVVGGTQSAPPTQAQGLAAGKGATVDTAQVADAVAASAADHGSATHASASAAAQDGDSLDKQVDGILGHENPTYASGMDVGHVNAGMANGEKTGTHAETGTDTSVSATINASGVRIDAHESADAQAGATYNVGPASLEANAQAGAHATESIHAGAGGIDVTLKGGVDASASVGASVSGDLGHGVSASIGVSDTAEAHADAGVRISNTDVDGAVRAGASNTTEVGAGIKVDVGGCVTVTNEQHASIVESASAAGQAGIGTHGVSMDAGASAGVYASAGASTTVGNSHYNVTAGGSVDSPGAVGFQEGGSATFKDDALSVDVHAKVDLGLFGVGFDLKGNFDLSAPIHAVEDAARHLASVAVPAVDAIANAAGVAVHGVESAATTVEHGVEHAGNTVAHGVVSTASTVEHGLESAGHALSSGANTVGSAISHGAQKFGHAVSHFFHHW